MENEDKFSAAVFSEFMARAQPLLDAALAERGVSSPEDLSIAEAGEVLENAIAVTALQFPDADAPRLIAGMRAFRHPRFMPAFKRIGEKAKDKIDSFQPAVGPDAAIVMAAFGIPVVPLDKKTGQPIGTPSDKLDDVVVAFDARKTAMVGYPAHEVEFYILATDCIRTLRKQITNPKFAEIRDLLARSEVVLPPDPGENFVHAHLGISRQTGDRFVSRNFSDPHPQRGSVLLVAAWSDGGEGVGVANGGYAPFFLRSVVETATNPRFASWLTEKKADNKPLPN